MQVAGIFPRTSSWQMTTSMTQEALTYLLELTSSMRYLDQAVKHVQEITKFYKKQLLAGQFLIELQQSQHVTHNIHSCFEKTTA
jgi:hypothetical protein